MKFTCFILLLLLPSLATAASGFIGAIGISSSTDFESEAETPQGDPYARIGSGYGLGFDAHLPVIGNFFIMNISVLWSISSLRANYSDRTNGLTANKLDGSFQNSMGLVGGKFRLLNLKRFQVYAGGGYAFGHMKLDYDEEKFKEINGGDDSRFIDNEEKKQWGPYLDATTDFILTKKSAIRLNLRRFNINSEAFKTLHNKRIESSYTTVSLQYMHYFEFKR